MSAVAVGLTAFGLILASIGIGLLMRYWVPESHISGDSKEVIRLATAAGVRAVVVAGGADPGVGDGLVVVSLSDRYGQARARAETVSLIEAEVQALLR